MAGCHERGRFAQNARVGAAIVEYEHHYTGHGRSALPADTLENDVRDSLAENAPVEAALGRPATVGAEAGQDAEAPKVPSPPGRVGLAQDDPAPAGGRRHVGSIGNVAGDDGGTSGQGGPWSCVDRARAVDRVWAGAHATLC